MSIRAALLLGGAPVVPHLDNPKDAQDAPRASEHYRRKGFEQDEIDRAYVRLMTGPRATRPRWKTIKRTIMQMRLGLPVGRLISWKHRKATA